MRAFISVVGLLCLAAFASASEDEKLVEQLEAVRNTLSALEDRAGVSENEFLFRPALDIDEIGKTYEYFKVNPRYRLADIRRKFPLLYCCAHAVLNTYEDNYLSMKGNKLSKELSKHILTNFYRALTDAYIEQRGFEFKEKRDNFELIADTPTYRFVKAITCGESGLTQEMVNEVVKEFYEQVHCDFKNTDGSEFGMMRAIERRAVYFGSTPTAVVRQRVGFLPEEKLSDLEEVKGNLLDGLERAGYTASC